MSDTISRLLREADRHFDAAMSQYAAGERARAATNAEIGAAFDAAAALLASARNRRRRA